MDSALPKKSWSGRTEAPLGTVELPQCHERQQGVLRDQSHEVSEPGVSGQCWHIIERLPVEVAVMEPYVPRNRGPDEQLTPDPRGW